MHRQLVYIYLLNVPSFSSRYFNKIKRTSRLGRLHALSLEILFRQLFISKEKRFLFVSKMLAMNIFTKTNTCPFPFCAKRISDFSCTVNIQNNKPINIINISVKTVIAEDMLTSVKHVVTSC